MRAPRLVHILVALMFAAGGTAAHASSIGGLDTTSLGAWAIAGGTGASTVTTWADFTGADATNLVGLSLDGPGTWSVTGSWTIQTNQAAASSAAVAKLWVPTGTENATAVATLTFGVTARAGLLVLFDATKGIYALYSEASGGTIELYKNNAGETLLASVTGVGTPASATMELDATTNTLKVSFAGTEVLTYTLTAGEITVFKNAANDGFGSVADFDTISRFDDFHVDS